MSSKGITLVEVGPRDGLQSEPEILPTDSKVEFISKAIDAGIRRLEVASFVHPQRVPQMADAEALIERLPDHDDVSYVGLIMNERGLDRALETKIGEIGMVVLSTDSYNRKNQGVDIDESIRVWGEIAKRAQENGLRANVMISSAFGCPYEGEVKVERIVELAKRLIEAGPAELGIADSIGVAVPSQVTELLGRVGDVIGDLPLRCHFHNTRNTGLANAQAAVESGVTYLDASIGGIGGCPLLRRRQAIFLPMICCTCLTGPELRLACRSRKSSKSAVGLSSNLDVVCRHCCPRPGCFRPETASPPDRGWLAREKSCRRHAFITSILWSAILKRRWRDSNALWKSSRLRLSTIGRVVLMLRGPALVRVGSCWCALMTLILFPADILPNTAKDFSFCHWDTRILCSNSSGLRPVALKL